MRFANVIKSIRTKKFLTQKELGEMLDVSAANISAWETGKSYPTFQVLIRIAQYCKNNNIDFDISTLSE